LSTSELAFLLEIGELHLEALTINPEHWDCEIQILYRLFLIHLQLLYVSDLLP
jgi:hypothetical protein